MPPAITHPTLSPAILEAHLTGPSGTLAKFRWHQTPCPGNEQVSIFHYRSDGEYEQSFYIKREAARTRWENLINDDWLVTQQPTVV